jgi:hypothetical protein
VGRHPAALRPAADAAVEHGAARLVPAKQNEPGPARVGMAFIARTSSAKKILEQLN